MEYTFFINLSMTLKVMKGHIGPRERDRERQRERVTESERESVCERERN